MSDIPADIVIYALVAAGLIFWLRSILGTRHGDEPQRPNPYVTPDEDKKEGEVSTPALLGADAINKNINVEDVYDPFNDDKLAPLLDVRETLREIGRKDRSFEPASFLKNAEDAFVMVVEAFAEGDKEFLQPMLSEDVFTSFEAEIDRRKFKGEIVQTDIHAIRKSEISGAKIEGKMAYVSVNILAEETCVIKDGEGNTLSGNPNRATEMNDIWVFGRSLKSRDPVWRVYETHDGNVKEDHKTPVPETGE